MSEGKAKTWFWAAAGLVRMVAMSDPPSGEQDDVADQPHPPRRTTTTAGDLHRAFEIGGEDVLHGGERFLRAQHHVGFQIMAQAAEQAKSVDPKKVAEAMRSGKAFKTVIGDIAFDKKGDITRPDYTMYVWKKQGDKITYVEQK